MNFQTTAAILIQETLESAVESVKGFIGVKSRPAFERMDKAQKICFLDALINRLSLATQIAKVLKVEIQAEDKK